MTLSKNDYLKKEDIRGNRKFMHIMGVLNDLVFPSMEFRSYNEKEINGVLPNRECADGSFCHRAELYAEGWTPCTAQEAGAPKESWRPADSESYFYAILSNMGVTSGHQVWRNDGIDKNCLSIGNIHKTSEEAIAWLKSKLDLKV